MTAALRAYVVVVLLLVLGGCTRPPKVAGETDTKVTSVTLQAAGGGPLSIDHGALFERLGMRKGSLIMPMRYHSAFREQEDRRRITAFWQTYGYFDVQVDDPVVVRDPDENAVAISWSIEENQRYAVASVHLLHAPAPFEAELREMISFGAGDTAIDLEAFRHIRVTMADLLRDEGYGHAMVYSRTFVDRNDKVVHWYYYVDAGPLTRVGKIDIEGNSRIPDELVLARIGMKTGDAYSQRKRIEAEFDLLDTGAFASAFIRPNTDTVFLVPGDTPDTGGNLRPEQIDEEGNLVPRELSPDVDLIVHLVEAPRVQVRVGAGAELDPQRFDTALTADLWFRDLFAPLHHLLVQGRVGYGWLYRSTTDEPTGIYGDALVRYVHPGFLARLLDLRVTAAFRQELLPGFHLRELTAGPGVRTTFFPGLFFDLDVLARHGTQLDFGPFDAGTRDAFSLPDADEAYGLELRSGLVWDGRDNPVEPLRGHYLALSSTFAPGSVLSTHRYLTLAPEARGYLPLTPSLSLALRGSAGWALLGDEAGVPLGPRWFGGGSYGMRGFGRNQLSPLAPRCLRTGSGDDPTPDDPGSLLVCQGQPVGGLSLVEATLEGRFLPPRAAYGLVVFADVGAAGRNANPFEQGIAFAPGLGVRLRLWYLPMAIDVAYRLLDQSEVQVLDDEPFRVFFRVGEAF